MLLESNRRRTARSAAGPGANKEGAIRAAINIGRDADRRRRGKMSVRDLKRLRQKEIKNKIDVLQGDRAARYKRYRDAKSRGDGGEAGSARDDDEDDEEAEARNKMLGYLDLQDANPDNRSRWDASSASSKADDEAGDEAYWSFERDDPTKKYVKKRAAPEPVSDEARALAAVELEGSGRSSASTKELLEAAKEFKLAKEDKKTAALLEIARERVNLDQAQRKIDLATAQQLDEECLWELANAYSRLKRLTLASEAYRELKDGNITTPNKKAEASQLWAQILFKISEELFNRRRFKDSLEVTETILTECTPMSHGRNFLEEVELYKAMTLKEAGDEDLARETLGNIIRTTSSRKRRMQATFVLDVMNVDTTGWRNTEMHEVFDQTFKLPGRGGYAASPVRAASARYANETPRERAIRTWVAEYWEERMKSPVYYAFLTLWVTWPFAIPVVSIMNKVESVPQL